MIPEFLFSTVMIRVPRISIYCGDSRPEFIFTVMIRVPRISIYCESGDLRPEFMSGKRGTQLLFITDLYGGD